MASRNGSTECGNNGCLLSFGLTFLHCDSLKSSDVCYLVLAIRYASVTWVSKGGLCLGLGKVLLEGVGIG